MTKSGICSGMPAPYLEWPVAKTGVSLLIAAALVMPALGQEPTDPQIVETHFTKPPEVATLRELPFRTETIEIEVNPFSVNFGQVEYKVSMREGDLLLYSWTSDRPLIVEFHGHTPEDGSGPIQVMNYVAGNSTSGNGTLIAPFDGIHGWYFANSAFEDPARVQITMSGYFELEPGIIALER